MKNKEKLTYVSLAMLVFMPLKLTASNNMNFHIYQPCNGNGSVCSPYILADGIITQETPKEFKYFIENNRDSLNPLTTVYLNSEGGSLTGGMELAKIIRSEKFNTYIGTSEKYDEESEEGYITLIQKSICYSACAYAFLGGVSREIDWGNGFYGIHQFYSDGYAPIDEGDTQVILSSLAIFLDNMGVDRKLLDFASFTKKDDIFLLSKKLAKKFQVDNSGEEYTGWKVDVNQNGELSVCSSAKQEDNDSFTMMCFIKSDHQLMANIIYSPSSRYVASNIIEAFKIEDESMLQSLYIKFDNKAIPIKKASSWKYNNNYLVKSFIITREMLKYLPSKQEFSIEANFSNATRHLDPSATFTTDGLHNAIKALLK